MSIDTIKSSSGIRASGLGSGDYVKKILLKDVATYGPWKAKLTSILDAEDCWEMVNGTEVEPTRIAIVNDADDAPENKVEVDIRLAEIKDYRKRSKKAASLIIQTIDDSIVMSLDVHGRDPVLMWIMKYKAFISSLRTRFALVNRLCYKENCISSL